MWLIGAVPFLVQIVAIGVDEYYFHIKRGLPKWERIGHPLDTLTVLLCFAFALIIAPSEGMIKWYVALGILSCLMITKDEFVHKHYCPPAEHWLHAVLFINHPILLTSMGLMWYYGHGFLFLALQALAVFGFFLYQVIYWNFIWQEDPA